MTSVNFGYTLFCVIVSAEIGHSNKLLVRKVWLCSK